MLWCISYIDPASSFFRFSFVPTSKTSNCSTAVVKEISGEYGLNFWVVVPMAMCLIFLHIYDY